MCAVNLMKLSDLILLCLVGWVNCAVLIFIFLDKEYYWEPIS